MKWFKKMQEHVDRAQLEVDDALTEKINEARKTGSLREHKGVPLKDNKKGDKK